MWLEHHVCITMLGLVDDKILPVIADAIFTLD
jgi:hypothetical protein